LPPEPPLKVAVSKTADIKVFDGARESDLKRRSAGGGVIFGLFHCGVPVEPLLHVVRPYHHPSRDFG